MIENAKLLGLVFFIISNKVLLLQLQMSQTSCRISIGLIFVSYLNPSSTSSLFSMAPAMVPVATALETERIMVQLSPHT